MGVVTVECIGVGEGIDVTEQQIEDLVFEESIWGASRYRLRISVADEAPWREFVTDPEKTFRIRFKSQGATKGDQGTSQTATKTVKAAFTNLSNIRDLPTFKLQGSDPGWDLLHEVPPSTIYKGQPLSAMVSTIANRHGLKSDVSSTLGAYTLWQCGYPDGYFIRVRLLPRAYSATRSDYHFYVKNGDTLVFKPPDLSREVGRFVIPQTGKEGELSVEDYEYDFRDGMLPALRALSVRLVGVDPISKKTISFTADDASVSSYKKLGQVSPPPPVRPSRILATTAPWGPKYDKADVQHQAEAVWSEFHRERCELRMRLRGFLAVGPGDVIRVDSQHFTGGKYLVGGIRQWMNLRDREMWTTVFATRRETN